MSLRSVIEAAVRESVVYGYESFFTADGNTKYSL